uniref:Uncharacterized protein n=1 Tax=Physcomitrium patens TaxID=3218 RepID=A0A2K1L6N6_PHYPA|nr:hypothetical protein PHYPA_000097 [Physcomitrium patens]
MSGRIDSIRENRSATLLSYGLPLFPPPPQALMIACVLLIDFKEGHFLSAVRGTGFVASGFSIERMGFGQL